MSCIELFAAYGFAVADIDRRKVYEVPAAIVEHMTLGERLAAKVCAVRLGIHWRIVK